MHFHTALMIVAVLSLSCTSKGDSTDRSDSESFLQPPGNGSDTGRVSGEENADTGHDGTTDTANEDQMDRDSGEHEENPGGDTDGDFPLDGIGDIRGDCDVISLPQDAGLWVHNVLDFGSEVFDETLLSHGGSALFEAGTLGGSSIHSEVIAFEVLHRCEIAFLVKTEGEIEYTDESGKKTDMLVEIDGLNVGVSVTRAFKWGEDAIFTEADAHTLLSNKLEDVLLSSANASLSNAWNHAILHVIAYDSAYVDALEAAYATLPTGLTDDTIVVVNVTDGDDAFLY